MVFTLKPTVRFLVAFSMTFSVGIAQQGQETFEFPSVVFTDVEYKLAWVDSGDGSRSRTNEYLKEGETLEDWSAMVAVRHWPHLHQVREITKPYLDQIRHLFVQDAQVYASESNREETGVVIECYLAPPDKSYLEYNLIRFCTEPGDSGVKSYQFAVRGHYNLPAANEFNQERLAERLEALSKLKLKAYSKMPAGDQAVFTSR